MQKLVNPCQSWRLASTLRTIKITYRMELAKSMKKVNLMDFSELLIHLDAFVKDKLPMVTGVITLGTEKSHTITLAIPTVGTNIKIANMDSRRG